MKKINRVSDLTPDDRNANKGTERGRGALTKSIERLGIGRSVLADREGRIIAGNKTVEVAVEKGIEEVVVVPSDGRKLVIVQRTDLDLTKHKAARELAVADNRVAQLDLDWDAEELIAMKEDGIDLVSLGFSDADILPDSAEKHWLGMPEFDQQDQMPWKTLYVHFKSAKALAKFTEIVGQEITEETRSIWFPAAAKKKVANKRYVKKGKR